MKRRCGVLKKFDSRTGANYTYMSHPFSHSDLLRIIEEYLTRTLPAPTLEVEGCVRALNQAFDFFKQHNISTHNMIHHSDRGVQYASTRYTNLLCSQGYRISMIQTGNPPHNALAERMNNTLKNSWYISSVEQTSEEATQVVARAVAYQ